MEKSPDHVYGKKITKKNSSKDKRAGKKKASASMDEKLSASNESQGDNIDVAKLLRKASKKNLSMSISCLC